MIKKGNSKVLSLSCTHVRHISGAVLGLRLQRTEMIYSHGLDLLSAVPSSNIKDQVCAAYIECACGSNDPYPLSSH